MVDSMVIMAGDGMTHGCGTIGAMVDITDGEDFITHGAGTTGVGVGTTGAGEAVTVMDGIPLTTVTDMVTVMDITIGLIQDIGIMH